MFVFVFVFRRMAFSSFSFHCSCSYSNNDVNAEILKSYTGSRKALPALVLVNHDKVGPLLASFCSLFAGAVVAVITCPFFPVQGPT